MAWRPRLDHPDLVRECFQFRLLQPRGGDRQVRNTGECRAIIQGNLDSCLACQGSCSARGSALDLSLDMGLGLGREWFKIRLLLC